MHFALLGTHPHGLEIVAALVASGRHQLTAWTGSKGDTEQLSWAAGARRVSDAEEVLADPTIEAVIVAGTPSVRPDQLRRALQSERHVLCVHPPDETPALAYEAAMLRDDVRVVLLPLLPDGLHPAVRRLATLVQRDDSAISPVGTFALLDIEWTASDEALIDVASGRPSFPGWDVVRAIGGEVAEVSGFAEADAFELGSVVLLAGAFARGGLVRVALLPRRPGDGRRLTLFGSTGRADLHFPQGDRGQAYLSFCRPDGEPVEEAWERWDPWPTLVEQFEAALAKRPTVVTWQDAIRAQELDDAARRSVIKRRADRLEYPEANEAVGFKGTMTLVGCGVLLVSVLLLVLARWVPQAGWAIVPLLVVFLTLQLLRPLSRRSDERE